jgi:hypothetical protein
MVEIGFFVGNWCLNIQTFTSKHFSSVPSKLSLEHHVICQQEKEEKSFCIFLFFQIKFEISNLFSQLPLAKMLVSLLPSKTIFLLIPPGKSGLCLAYKHMQLFRERGGELAEFQTKK